MDAKHGMTQYPARITARVCLFLAACAACVLLNLMLTGCEHDPAPKQRPTDVPLAAVWVGGTDGGSYYDCSIGSGANDCTVWNDASGEVTLTGHFILDVQNRPATTTEMKFTGTDGKRIFLANNLILRPIMTPAK